MEVLFAHFLFQEKVSGGDNRARTDDPLLAKQVLSQLSYTPIPSPREVVVGLDGL